MADSLEVIEARERTNDREFFFERVKEIPTLIEWANDEIRDDKDVIMNAVKADSGALEFASDRLKDDKDIILEAVAKVDGHVAMQVID